MQHTDAGIRAHLDFETGSNAPLGKGPNNVGVHRYAEDMTTRVWGFRYKIGAAPQGEWRPGYPEPWDLLIHIAAGGIVVAHNAAFERLIWRMMRAKYKLGHWPEMRIEQQRCTMAKASASNLPADLDTLAKVLNLPILKDEEGTKVMLSMAKPNKVYADGTMHWNNERWRTDRLMAYCGVDVDVEELVDNRLFDLTAHEQQVWELDQRINDRGLKIDINAVVRAVDLVEIAKARADKRMSEITQGAVPKCSQVQRLVEWIQTRGFDFESVKKDEQEDIITYAGFCNDEVVVEAVRLRQDASKTSTAKYKKMLAVVCSDDRVRGSLQYHGAATGRWAGRGIQPQNLYRIDSDTEAHVPALAIAALHTGLPLAGVHDLLEMTFGSVMGPLAKSMRAVIVADEGHKFIGGDFANIEGRVNAWLAGEAWKLEAFIDYDNGVGPDLYKVAYSRSFGEPVETIGKGRKRQIGKVQELSMGYQGGVGAFIKMGVNYGVRANEVVDAVREATTKEMWTDTQGRYKSATDKCGLDMEAWTAVKLIVIKWRTAHTAIMKGWWELADAAVAAVDDPGTKHYVYGSRACYVCMDDWLYCMLPSGRILQYANPRIRETTQTLVDKNGDEYTRLRRTVWYFGRDSQTKKWGYRYIYGGLQCENIVQAVSRCVMDRAMLRAERAGYPLVLTVHDELLSEPPLAFGSEEHFALLMAEREPWYDTLPVAVSTWTDTRYVK